MDSEDNSKLTQKTPLGQRVELLIGNDTYSSFEKICHLTPNTISHIMRGRVPRGDVLVKIAETTGCDLNWLITGRPAGIPPEDRQRAGLPLRIPVVADAAAGEQEQEIRMEPAELGDLVIPAHAAAVRVHGDSMSPIIEDGQYVFVDDRCAPVDKDLVVCKVRGRDGTFFKRYYRDNNWIILESVNKARAIAPMIIHEDDVESIRVVVGTWRRRVPPSQAEDND